MFDLVKKMPIHQVYPESNKNCFTPTSMGGNTKFRNKTSSRCIIYVNLLGKYFVDIFPVVKHLHMMILISFKEKIQRSYTVNMVVSERCQGEGLGIVIKACEIC